MKLIRTVGAITYEAWCAVKYAIVYNVYNAAAIVSAALPYAMYAMGQSMALERGYFHFGAEIVVPILVGLVTYYAKEISNRSGKGKTVPMPARRFTTVDDDGEVTVDQARLHEMILYVADLEDWFAKRGML